MNDKGLCYSKKCFFLIELRPVEEKSSKRMAEVVENHVELNGTTDEAEISQSVAAIPKASLKEIVMTDYIRQSLDIVASSEGFRNYEIIFDHGSNIGDGFVGIILKVKIKENDSDKSLSVLAKIPPQNKARREMPGTMVTFEREVYLYNVLLPELIAFQKEKRVNRSQGFFNIPKVYYADYDSELRDSIIVMEDLRETGHRMWDKYKPIDLEHSKLLMESLGRLHALSFAMKKKKPEFFEKLHNLKDIFVALIEDENMKGFLEQSMVRCCETLDPNDTKNRQKFMKIAQNMSETMASCVNIEASEPYAVLNHGDCWMNNFLYHYDRRGKPDEIVFIDWQISRYCSPVVDLAYFIFICTDKQTRDKHFDELLNLYHRSLKEFLDHLGGDTATQFPFTAFLRHFKRFGKVGILSACFAVPMLQTKNEDMLDMDVMAEKMQNMDPKEMEEIGKLFMEMNKDGIEKINKRIRDAILDGIRYGYL